MADIDKNVSVQNETEDTVSAIEDYTLKQSNPDQKANVQNETEDAVSGIEEDYILKQSNANKKSKSTKRVISKSQKEKGLLHACE